MALKKVKTNGTGGNGGKSRYITRVEAKDGARKRRRRQDQVAVRDQKGE